MRKILIICTGNSCRSQMAEGFLRSLDSSLYIRSAGTKPGPQVAPKAVQVMAEIGLDISHHQPELVDQYLNEAWDFVITVCDSAKEACPYFPGKVDHRLHIGFDDPWEATGTEEEILGEYRRVRDEIRRDFTKFYEENLKA
jgi:arsenate reductase (thioredoxin)